jgi:hypothetical protein
VLLWWFAAGWLQLLALATVIGVLAKAGTPADKPIMEPRSRAAHRGRRAAGCPARTTTRGGRGRDRSTGSDAVKLLGRQLAASESIFGSTGTISLRKGGVDRGQIVAGPTATAVAQRRRCSPPPGLGHGCAEAYVPSLGRRIRAVNLGTTGFTTSSATQHSLAMSGATR